MVIIKIQFLWNLLECTIIQFQRLYWERATFCYYVIRLKTNFSFSFILSLNPHIRISNIRERKNSFSNHAWIIDWRSSFYQGYSKVISIDWPTPSQRRPKCQICLKLHWTIPNAVSPTGDWHNWPNEHCNFSLYDPYHVPLYVMLL